MSKRLTSAVILNIIFVQFASRAVFDIFLAFANSSSAPLFSMYVKMVIYSTVPLGILYICLFIKGKTTWKNAWIVSLPCLYYFYLVVNTYGGYQYDWITSLIAICSFCLMVDRHKAKVFNIFYWIIQGNNVFSLFFYVCYMLDINIGITKIVFYIPGSKEKGFYYLKWLIFAIVYNGESTRLCGIFNEPGALGTICALLFVTRFKYSRLWEKTLLVVTTFCTLSMAGVLLLFLYFAMYMVRKNWKNVIFLALFGLAFLWIPKIDWGNEDINNLAKRFEITDEGLAGNNRTTEEFDEKFEVLMHSSEAWFGKGAGYTLAAGSLSYKMLIVWFGIVGFVILIGAWSLVAIKVSDGNLDCYILLALFMVSLYQRPSNIASIYGYVLLFGGMEWLRLQEAEHKSSRLMLDIKDVMT